MHAFHVIFLGEGVSRKKVLLMYSFHNLSPENMILLYLLNAHCQWMDTSLFLCTISFILTCKTM